MKSDYPTHPSRISTLSAHLSIDRTHHLSSNTAMATLVRVRLDTRPRLLEIWLPQAIIYLALRGQHTDLIANSAIDAVRCVRVSRAVIQRVTSERAVPDALLERVHITIQQDTITTETRVIPAEDGRLSELASFVSFVPVPNTLLDTVGKGRAEERVTVDLRYTRTRCAVAAHERACVTYGMAGTSRRYVRSQLESGVRRLGRRRGFAFLGDQFCLVYSLGRVLPLCILFSGRL